MLTFLRALRHRPFALLWSGQSISVLGDRMSQVALAWWVLEETGSAVAMATVFVLGIVPMLIFLLIGGVLVDRYSRVWLMLIADGTRGLGLGLTALLAFAGRLDLWHIFAQPRLRGGRGVFRARLPGDGA